jgi:hypothetical protein
MVSKIIIKTESESEVNRLLSIGFTHYKRKNECVIIVDPSVIMCKGDRVKFRGQELGIIDEVLLNTDKFIKQHIINK